MKTTNSKDLVKVNQILPIMQEHFGQSMNLARIKLMYSVSYSTVRSLGTKLSLPPAKSCQAITKNEDMFLNRV